MALSFDSSVNTVAAVAATNSASATITYPTTGDILVVITHGEWGTAGGLGHVSSVTSTSGLTWVKRQAQTAAEAFYPAQEDLEIWWAYNPNANTSDVITVTWAGATGSLDAGKIAAFAVTGFTGTEYQTNPWDLNPSLIGRATSNVATTYPNNQAVSTISSSGMAFSIAATDSGGTYTSGQQPSGFTFSFSNGALGSSAASYMSLAYDIYSTPFVGLPVSWTSAGTQQGGWVAVVDALSTNGAFVQPLTIDGTPQPGIATSATNTSLTTGLTYPAGGDIIVVYTSAEWPSTGLSAAGNVSSITSTSGLTFKKRSSYSGLQYSKNGSGTTVYHDFEVWWAVAPFARPTVPDVVTAHFNMPTGATYFDTSSIAAFAVTGFSNSQYTTNPWDANTSLPLISSANASSIPNNSGLNTSSNNGMILTFLGSGGPTASYNSVPTGYTSLANAYNSGGTLSDSVAAGYLDFGTFQVSNTVTWAAAFTNSYVVISDALSAYGSANTTPVPIITSKVLIDAQGSVQDNTAGGTTTNYTGLTTTINSTNSNGAILLFVAMDSQSVTGLTVNWDSAGANTPMTLITSKATGPTNVNATYYVYGLINPTTYGNKTITLKWTGSAKSSAMGISFIGVNTSSIGSAFIASTSNGTSTASSINVTGGNNDIICAIQGSGSSTPPLNSVGGKLFFIDNTNTPSWGGSMGYGPSVTLNGVWGSSYDWTCIGIDVVANPTVSTPVYNKMTFSNAAIHG